MHALCIQSEVESVPERVEHVREDPGEVSLRVGEAVDVHLRLRVVRHFQLDSFSLGWVERLQVITC